MANGIPISSLFLASLIETVFKITFEEEFIINGYTTPGLELCIDFNGLQRVLTTFRVIFEGLKIIPNIIQAYGLEAERAAELRIVNGFKIRIIARFRVRGILQENAKVDLSKGLSVRKIQAITECCDLLIIMKRLLGICFAKSVTELMKRLNIS